MKESVLITLLFLGVGQLNAAPIRPTCANEAAQTIVNQLNKKNPRSEWHSYFDDAGRIVVIEDSNSSRRYFPYVVQINATSEVHQYLDNTDLIYAEFQVERPSNESIPEKKNCQLIEATISLRK